MKHIITIDTSYLDAREKTSLFIDMTKFLTDQKMLCELNLTTRVQYIFDGTGPTDDQKRGEIYSAIFDRKKDAVLFRQRFREFDTLYMEQPSEITHEQMVNTIRELSLEVSQLSQEVAELLKNRNEKI